MQEFYYVIQETFNPNLFLSNNRMQWVDLQKACRFLDNEEAKRISNLIKKETTVRKIKVVTEITLVSE